MSDTTKDCPNCDGSGTITRSTRSSTSYTDNCGRCNGHGYLVPGFLGFGWTAPSEKIDHTTEYDDYGQPK